MGDPVEQHRQFAAERERRQREELPVTITNIHKFPGPFKVGPRKDLQIYWVEFSDHSSMHINSDQFDAIRRCDE